MPKKFDHEKYIEKQLEKLGAKKLSERYYYRNGWRIKFNRNGVYWHTRIVKEFPIAFDGLDKLWEEKGDKPYTPAEKLKKDTIDRFLSKTSTKTRRLINRETKKKKAEERKRARRLKKRAWCKGCEFSPQGVDSPKCEKMRYNEAIGHFYCNEAKWWNYNWCYNAERIVPKKGKRKGPICLGKFKCKVTGEWCPFNKETMTPGEFILGRDLSGKHFTSCSMFEGHRKEAGVIIDELNKRMDAKPTKRKRGRPKKKK